MKASSNKNWRIIILEQKLFNGAKLKKFFVVLFSRNKRVMLTLYPYHAPNLVTHANDKVKQQTVATTNLFVLQVTIAVVEDWEQSYTELSSKTRFHG